MRKRISSNGHFAKPHRLEHKYENRITVGFFLANTSAASQPFGMAKSKSGHGLTSRTASTGPARVYTDEGQGTFRDSSNCFGV